MMHTTVSLPNGNAGLAEIKLAEKQSVRRDRKLTIKIRILTIIKGVISSALRRRRTAGCSQRGSKADAIS
jgi:hypothetical protein